MKKVIFAMMFLMGSVCYADNSKQIKELTAEHQKMQQIISQAQIRSFQIEGAIQVLTEQDEAKKKKKVSKKK